MLLKSFNSFFASLLVILFSILLPGCSRDTFPATALFYSNYNENIKEDEFYVIKNNGDTVRGKQATGSRSGWTSSNIEIDNQKFDYKEIKGFRIYQTFYLTKGRIALKRILNGPLINLYANYEQKTLSGSPNGSFHYVYYAQKGENGEFMRFQNMTDLKKIIEDCPIAARMADISDAELIKIIKTDNFYLYKVMRVYNNGCKN